MVTPPHTIVIALCPPLIQIFFILRYYKKLSAFVEQYEMRWDGQREIQTYLVALSLGLQDFLGEYTASIATLEQTILQEGPLPLSFVTQHFQKYLLSMPVVWRICCDINERELKGCQILDYLSFYKSGVPVISLVVARLLLRVRVVFLKQSMAWMVHGELNDPASEYFIQHHKHSFSQGSGHHRCFTASPKEDAELAFDWGSSYSLKLSRIPESHVSPRLASTILFVGKAVTLLAFSNSQSTEKNGTSRNQSTAFQEVFDYFSGRRRDAASAPVTANMPTSLGDAPESLHADGADLVKATLTDHFSNNGFSAEDIHRFSMQYEHILTHQAHAVASFEALVTTISETVSRSLWRLLRDVHDFRQFTHTLRNTYLMGRGEFFQSILDNIWVLISESSSYEEGDEIDALLRERILKAAAEKHGFDDGSLIRFFQIRVNSPVVRVSDFVSEALVFTGTAGNVKQSGVHVGLLCTAPLLSASSSFEPIWTNLLKLLEVSGADATVEQKSQLPLYTSGSLWLPDLKFIAKGFTMSAAFSLDWNAVMASISPSHPNLLPSSLEPSATLEEGGRSLLLGSMAVVVHGDKQGPRAVGTGSLGCDILRSLAAGVSFHTCRSLSDSSSPTLQYYARLFVSMRGSAVSTVLAERRVQLSFNQRATDESLLTNHRTCNASVDLIFELEYAREFAASEDRSGSGGVVNLVLKVRLKEASPKTAAPLAWDIELPLDISSGSNLFLRCAYFTI